ncbi:hypothetical protein NC652_037226 [Populus alba x Populus x berolinensis]|nr:hypothetical protein NC652_037226 [Populus alba x Populus x berolinensis]
MSEKVATHVHHSACMNQKHLLRFIKSKLRKEPDEVVIFRDGTYLNIERKGCYHIDICGNRCTCGTIAHFIALNKFNLKYNPFCQSRLREIFLKQDNLIQGRFLEELTKQMVEYRISIYGRKQSEWDQIASWILPRLYNIYKEIGLLHHFRIFLIISSFRFSRSQLIQMSHPQLHVYLETGCWAGRCLMMKANLKDDPQSTCLHKINVPMCSILHFHIMFITVMPTSTTLNKSSQMFYLEAVFLLPQLIYYNIVFQLRESKGHDNYQIPSPFWRDLPATITYQLSWFRLVILTILACHISLRPHNIAHGINLSKSPRMVAFLLYQIGLAMSPLSQQFLIFRTTIGILFQCFFQRGLNVSLSTDDAAPNSRLEVEFIVICVRLLEIQYTKFKFPTCFKVALDW